MTEVQNDAGEFHERSERASRRRRVLVLWADEYSTNLGVRALAEGTAALVHQADDTAKVELQSYGKGAAPRTIDSRALLKLGLGFDRALSEWLSGYDLVIDTGAGDSYADIYGLRRFVEMTCMRRAVVRAGVPLILGPQTFGPFNRRSSKVLARWGVREATTVVARDRVSHDYAEHELGAIPLLASDVVFALPAVDVVKSRDVVLNVSGLLWAPNAHVDHMAYQQNVVRLIEGLHNRGRTVSVLAHVLESSNHDSDIEAAEQVIASVEAPLELVVPTGLTDARHTIASATVLIGSRMHACLNALSLGVPAIPWAYSRKFAPLLSGVGWEHIIDLRTDDEVVGRTLAILDDMKSLSASAGDVRGLAGLLNRGVVAGIAGALA